MIRIIYLCVAMMIGLTAMARGADPVNLLEQAAKTYKDALNTTDRNHRVQKFRTAESLFARVVESQSAEKKANQNPELFVNLGNAALGAEHVGPAVLAYRRALKSDPNHARAKQNLEHARTLIADWVPKPEEDISLGSFFDWTKHFDSNDWRGMAAVVFFLAAICFAVYFRFESRTMRNIGAMLSVAWVLILVVSFVQSNAKKDVAAVIVIPETIARSADSINSPSRFPEPLPGGTELEIVEDRGDWLRVRLYDGREVWITDSAAEPV